MEVSDVQALVRVLDQKCLEYKVDSKSCVDVFGSFEVTDLVLSLEKEGCKVLWSIRSFWTKKRKAARYSPW